MSKKISYIVDIDANLGALEGKLNTVKGLMGRLTENGANPEITKVFDQIGRSIDALRTKAAQPISSNAAFAGFTKETANITLQIEKLITTLNTLEAESDGELLNLLPPEVAKNINDAVAALATFSNAIEKATAETAELTSARKDLAKAEENLSKWQGKRGIAEASMLDAKKQLEASQQLRTAAEERLATLKRERDEAQRRIEEINAIYNSMPAGQKVDKRKKVKLSDGTETTLAAETRKKGTATQGIETTTAEIETLDKTISSQTTVLKKFTNEFTTAESRVAAYGQVVTECKTKLEALTRTFNTGSASAQKKAFDDLRASAERLGLDLTGISTEGTEQDIERLTALMGNLVTSGMDQVTAKKGEMVSTLQDMGGAAHSVGNAVGQASEEFQRMQESANQMNALKSRIKQFFSAAGVIRLFTQTVRSAFNTVKELDAIMTEMAVVTDFEIGDFWDQMPEYTQRANELGVAIGEVYKAQTLFYQQGLKTAQAAELANETLKMAKIAGLDAADATDRMTAALRGFNMELNEASAQRVADVYSQLAAITASDVDEISTAMTKTASIASSAGMEFETTAAFLSQIIETTRESAETAGTAMKTVIARFQELKKDPAEIGEVDGEIVDANKIETALRTVGVSLRDASGQFRDLDDVFMELAGKWDGLDTNTQRYIATIAAGSRQQSRFIAMMSDYGRTQELVGEAQDSAGASQKQYNKTLDGLESKLAQLKNAWDQFTTGIMNSEFIKGAVTFLTSLLNAINKVTEGFGGFTQSISKIGMVIGIINIAKGLIRKLGLDLTTTITNAGTAAGQAFYTEFKKGIDGVEGELNDLSTPKTPPPPPPPPASSPTGSKPPVHAGGLASAGLRITTNTVREDPAAAVRQKTHVQRDLVAEPPPESNGWFAQTYGNVKTGFSQMNSGMQSFDATRNWYNEQAAGIMGNMGNDINVEAEQGKIDFAQAMQPKFNAGIVGGVDMATAVQGAGVGDMSAAVLPLEQIEAQFKEKMTNMGIASDEAAAKWDTLAASFQEDGTTAAQALDKVNAELQETASKAAPDKKPKTDAGARIQYGEREAAGMKNNSTNASNQIIKKQQLQKKGIQELRKLDADYAKMQQKNQKQIVDGYSKMNKSITNVGSTLSMVGAGFSMIGGALEKAGVKGAAETFGKLGNVLSTVGGLMSVFGSIMGALTPVVSSITAAISAKTTATTAEVAATVADTGATTANTVATTGDTVATGAHAAAKGTEAAAEGVETGAAIANTGAKYAQAGGEVAATTAAWPMAIVMLVIVSIIIILVALIFALVAAFKALEAASPEGQLKAAQEAADNAAQAADEAAEAYHNLADALDELKDKYKNLDNLTRGSKEWNEAVEDINNSVMDLIDEYPELASLMENKNGVLTIDVESEEVQDVLQSYEEDAVSAKSAELMAKAVVQQKQVAVDYKNLSDGAKLGLQAGEGAKAGAMIGGTVGLAGSASLGLIDPVSLITTGLVGAGLGAGIGAIVGAFGQEQEKRDTDAMAEALASGAAVQNENGEWEIKDKQKLAELGLTEDQFQKFAEELGDNAEELKKYGDSINQAKKANEAFYNSMAAQARQLVDTSKFTTSQLTAMDVVFDANNMEARVAAQADKIAALSEDDFLKEVKAQWGDDAEVDKDGNVTYKDAEGNEKTIEKDSAIQQLAAAKATKEAAKKMEEVPKALADATKDLGHEMREAFMSIFEATNGQAVTKKELSLLKTLTGDDLTDMWNNLTQDQKDIFGTYIDFSNKKFEAQIEARKTFDELEQKAAAEGYEILDNMIGSAATGFANHMTLIGGALGQGTTGLDKMTESLKLLQMGLNVDDFNGVVGIINGLDWNNANAWNELPSILKEAGYNVPYEALAQFIEEAKKASNAVNKINLEKLSEHLQVLQQRISEFVSGEGNLAEFEEDFVKGLTALNKNFGQDFLQNLDGTYTYIGGTMEDLIKAINDNTVAQLAQEASTIETKKLAGAVMEGLRKQSDFHLTATKKGETGPALDITNSNGWTTKQKKEYLQYVQKNSTHFDLSALSIPGLSNHAVFSNMSDSQIDDIIAGIGNVYSQYNSKDLERQTQDLYLKYYSSAYQNETIRRNSQENKGIREQLSDSEKMSSMPGRIDTLKTEMQSRTGVIISKAMKAGVNVDLINKYREIMQYLQSTEWYDEDGKLKTEVAKALTSANELENKMVDTSETLEKSAKILEQWKSSFDYLTNANERLNSTQRKRNEIEREFEKIARDYTTDTADVVKLTKDHVLALKEEAQIQREIAASSQLKINNALADKDNELFNQFIERDANGVIQIKWSDANEAFKDSADLGDAFEEYANNILDLQDTAEEAVDTANEMEDALQEIADKAKESYNELWQQIHDAMIDQKQVEIDSLSTINDSIQEAEDTIANQIQKQIDEQRQARQNEKTEENLAKSYEKLAALKRDTSGANAAEILKLEETLGTQEESYTNTLIDQTLQKLQQDSEIAAEQRQRQIDIAQSQLDVYSTSAQSWEQAKAYLEQSLSASGPISTNLMDLFKRLSWFDSKSPIDSETMKDNLSSWGASIIQGALIDNDDKNMSALIGKMRDTQPSLGGAITEIGNVTSTISDLINGNETTGSTGLSGLLTANQDDLMKVIGSTKEGGETIIGTIAGVSASMAAAEADKQARQDMANKAQMRSSLLYSANKLSSEEEFNKINTKTYKDPTTNKETTVSGLSGFDSWDEYQHSYADQHRTVRTSESLSGDSVMDEETWKENYTYKDKDDKVHSYTSHKDYSEYLNAHNAKLGIVKPSEPQKDAQGNVIQNSDQSPVSLKFVGAETDWQNSGAWFDGRAEWDEVNWNDADSSTDDGFIIITGKGEYKIRAQRDKWVTDWFRGEEYTKKYGDVSKTIAGQGDAVYNISSSAGGGWYGTYVWKNNRRVAYKVVGLSDGDLYALGGTPVAFKTGGLADFTGPAWLDGTPSKPEYILNAAQTERFFSLVDVLDSFDKIGAKNTSGDNYFDIDINVDNISDDYDVEQIADKIKEIIYEDSMYRNVNIINDIH